MKRAWAFSVALLGGYILVACGSAGGGGGGGSGQCGNQAIDSPLEGCDGKDLGTQTCKSLKFEAGTLACSATCTLDTKACCNNKCVNIGDTTCDKNQLKTCAAQPTGCRDYVLTTDCAATGKVCDTSSGKAQCKSNCTDACALAGSKQCNGASVETCTLGTDGCRDWVETVDCNATGQNCDPSSGTAQCTSNCPNSCPNTGDTQCSGNVIQTCTTSGGSCNSWVTTTDCSSQSKSCIINAGSAECGIACNNKCTTKGSQTCMGNVLSTCTADANGCLDFAATQDCTSTNTFCKLAGAGQAKCEPVCVDPCVTVGEKKCNANVIMECKQDPGGCKEWKINTTCPFGQTCSSSGGTYSCVTAPATGEDCGTALVVKAGLNTINWTATANNYMSVTKPSCATSYTISGGDVVLLYQPAITGIVDYTVNKPASNYQVIVAAGGSCGSFSNQLSCVLDYSNTSMGGTFNVTQGSTYFFYLADTTTGTSPLNNPLQLTIAEIDCTTFAASAVTLSPTNGGTTTSLAPKLTADFDTALKTNVGTVSLTGNKGTNISYNLAVSNTQITWTNSNKTLNITPGVAFPAGEVVTVTLTGLLDNKCGKAIKQPTWSFNIVTPPCSPGTNGMVGSGVTKQATGLPIVSEYYMSVDTSPTGYVYIGGPSELWRVQKATPTNLQSVSTLAAMTSTHLGYGMFMSGNDIFTVEAKTAGGTGWLWRISTTGGASWTTPLQDYANFSVVPADEIHAAVAYKGKIYMVTREFSTGTNTQIWSVPTTGTIPLTPTLESNVAGELYCTGIAIDDVNYYLACGTNERLVRINRSNSTMTVLSTQWDLDTTSTQIYADDTNNDGTADYLYFKGAKREVYFACAPGGATPYTDTLVNYGVSSSTYGLAFDQTNKKLYAFDDTSKELIVIQ